MVRNGRNGEIEREAEEIEKGTGEDKRLPNGHLGFLGNESHISKQAI